MNPDYILQTADEVGFEPTEPFSSTVFKTAAIDLSATHPKLVLLPGFAPGTKTYQILMITISPQENYFLYYLSKYWLEQLDSNQRSDDYESSALTTEL